MDLFGEAETVEKVTPNPTETSDTAFSHPREMDILIGHENTQKELLELLNTGKIPHGLILSGLKGIGKATLAYRLARFLLKTGQTDPNQDKLFEAEQSKHSTLELNKDDPIFSRVASGGHPDLLTLERQYDPTKNKTAETLAVSELRRVEPFLRMTSSNGGWRIVIIDDADTMNRNAQNALLKILEEPPPKTLIILITHRLGALIPTIRSRARTLNMKEIGIDAMTQLIRLKNEPLSQMQITKLIDMAEGSFGKLCNLIDENGVEALTTISELLENGSWAKIHTLADQTARAGQEQHYKNISSTLIWLMRKLTFLKARGEKSLPQYLETTTLAGILQTTSLKKLIETADALHNILR